MKLARLVSVFLKEDLKEDKNKHFLNWKQGKNVNGLLDMLQHYVRRNICVTRRHFLKAHINVLFGCKISRKNLSLLIKSCTRL